MAIGNFGKLITFRTSRDKILTFRDFNRDGGARWTTHSRINRKPLTQFLGPDIDTFSFEVVLDAAHGVKPRKTLDRIRKYKDAGTPAYLIIKGKKVSKYKLVITKMSETWDEIYNKGELVRATVKLEFQEYIDK